MVADPRALRTKYKMRSAAEPPATQVIMFKTPASRLGMFDGGGCGYVRGGTMGG